MAFIKISDLLTFTVGKTYYVTFEGTEYECVAWAGNDGSIVIGNGSIYGGDGGNGEPFSCNSYADGSCYLNTNDYGTRENQSSVSDSYQANGIIRSNTLSFAAQLAKRENTGFRLRFWFRHG